MFAVKRSLVRDFAVIDDPQLAQQYGMTSPYRHAEIDLLLDPARPADPGDDPAVPARQG